MSKVIFTRNRIMEANEMADAELYETCTSSLTIYKAIANLDVLRCQPVEPGSISKALSSRCKENDFVFEQPEDDEPTVENAKYWVFLNAFNILENNEHPEDDFEILDDLEKSIKLFRQALELRHGTQKKEKNQCTSSKP